MPFLTLPRVVAVAVLVRLTAVALLVATTPDAHARFESPDSREYLSLAQSLASGEFAIDGRLELNRPPGYPALLVGPVLAGHPVVGAIVLNLVASGVLVFLVFRLTLIVFGSRQAATLSALAAACEPGLVFWSTKVLADVTLAAVAAGTALAMVIWFDRKSPIALCAAGCLASAAAYVKPIAYFLPLACALLIVIAARRLDLRARLASAAVVLCLAVAILIPWHLRNWQRAQYAGFSFVMDRALVSAQAAVIADNTDTPFLEARARLYSDDRRSAFLLESGRDQVADFREFRQDIAGRLLGGLTTFGRIYAIGLIWTMTDTGWWDYFGGYGLAGSGVKSALFYEGAGAALRRLRYLNPGVLLTAVVLQLMLLIYVAAPVLSMQTIGVRRELAWVLLAIGFYFILLAGGPFANSRFRVPLMPLLSVMVGPAGTRHNFPGRMLVESPSKGTRVRLAAHPSTSIWSVRRVQEDPLAFLQTLAESGADVVPFRLGRRRAFLLNHPTFIEDVLVRHPEAFVKGRGYERARRLLGNGLLTASGSLHAARRQLAQPAFFRQRLASYARAMVAHAERLRDRWESGRPVDVAREMQALTLAIVGETLFGTDLSGRHEDVRAAVAMALPEMDGLISPVAGASEANDARRRLEAVVDEIVDARLRSGAAGEDLLSLLLEARVDESPESAQQLRDDALTVLLAGHDTISHALTWTWMLLAQHPEVEHRLRAELTEVAGARAVSADDLPRLTYTRNVLAEALRLFPPAWVIVRRSVAAHRFGDIEVPPAALVIASPFVTHRDARFFPDPVVFEPDRWLPAVPAAAASDQAGAARPRLAYFPFGAGPRSCIGEGFAWMEGTLVLATLAQRWRLTRPDTATLGTSPRITLRPQGTVLMTPERQTVT